MEVGLVDQHILEDLPEVRLLLVITSLDPDLRLMVTHQPFTTTAKALPLLLESNLSTM